MLYMDAMGMVTLNHLAHKVLSMEKKLHQLRLVVYPSIYKGLCIPGAAGLPPSTV